MKEGIAVNKNPLQSLIDLEPTLFQSMEKNRKEAFSDGKLELKYKFLIAMALDASHGAKDGVGALARLALENGATKEEIAETLKVLYYVSGGASMYVASLGLDGVI